MACPSCVDFPYDVKSKDEEKNRSKIDGEDSESRILKAMNKCIIDGDANGIKNLIDQVKMNVLDISKVKASKLIKKIIELFNDTKVDAFSPVVICEDFLKFSEKEDRIYLTQILKSKLLYFLYKEGNYSKAIDLASELIRQLKKIDDKELLIEVFLIESKIYVEIKNYVKSRASLTSAKTISNSIYISPKFQAKLDLQAGVLHILEKDYRTAYSYFYESFEACCNFDKSNVQKPLLYMVLCKLMLNSSDDVLKLISDKNDFTKNEKIFLVFKEIAYASKLSSLSMLQKCLTEEGDLLKQDMILSPHIQHLYDDLFEKNLLKVTKAYSRVEIAYLATIINLPHNIVQNKLSQMILDNKLSGVLDQGAGIFEIWDEENNYDDTELFDYGLELIGSMSKIVDILFYQAKNLH